MSRWGVNKTNIGNKLKEARMARGLTLEAVEEETKIRRKYLQALEEEKFHVLPGPIYAKAFLKNYAKFLNLDLEEILEAYNKQFALETVPEVAASAQAEPIEAKSPGKPRLWLYLAAAAVIVGLAFSVYYGAAGMGFNHPAGKTTEEARKEEPAQVPPGRQNQTPAGQEQAPGQGPAANATGVNMVLNVKDDRSWILVVADGNPIFQGIVSAGQSKNFGAKEKIYIRLGNAGVVEVQVNGQNLGFLGGPGDVVDQEFKAPPQG